MPQRTPQDPADQLRRLVAVSSDLERMFDLAALLPGDGTRYLLTVIATQAEARRQGQAMTGGNAQRDSGQLRTH